MDTVTRIIIAMVAAVLMSAGFAFAQSSPVGNTGRFEANTPCDRMSEPTRRADCARANGPMNAEPFKDRGGGSTGNRASDHRGHGAGKGDSMKGGSGARGSAAKGAGSGASHSGGGVADKGGKK